ncbi:hypothetical protein [Piscinibacter sp.]|jgi:hypothetical protein|uniref:hypothetical protein n=1 Tax=Piscinibacter sp. TaxID=1903157 RepID=UPI0035597808
MTLIVTIASRKSIWLLADRRLSYADGTWRDDAIKLTRISTPDGTGLIGYAGLGETIKGQQPSDWIVRVLRGRNFPFEKSIEQLAAATREHFKPHLSRLRWAGMPQHNFLIAAFVNGGARTYTIDLHGKPDHSGYWFRVARHVRKYDDVGNLRNPLFYVGGSGSAFLIGPGRNGWSRHLRRLIRALEQGRIKPESVAVNLARLNLGVHRQTATVGKQCIVAWVLADGTAAHMLYDGDVAQGAPFLPTISRGTDLTAFLKLLKAHTFTPEGHLREDGDGAQRAAEEFNQLPDTPDENLE